MKINTNLILNKPDIVALYACVEKMPQKASESTSEHLNFKNFLAGHAPPPPLPPGLTPTKCQVMSDHAPGPEHLKSTCYRVQPAGIIIVALLSIATCRTALFAMHSSVA